MSHPWLEGRPISPWIPAGYSKVKRVSGRKQRPIIDQEACTLCSLCWLFCPEGAIGRGQLVEVNYDYCRGCGLCAVECPKGAISMEAEE